MSNLDRTLVDTIFLNFTQTNNSKGEQSIPHREKKNKNTIELYRPHNSSKEKHDSFDFKEYYEKKKKRKQEHSRATNLKEPPFVFQEREKFINVVSTLPQTVIDMTKENLTNVLSVEIISSRFVNTTSGEDIFIESSVLGGDFKSISMTNNNIFAKIQIVGDNGDTIYNSWVGGKKVFYNNDLISFLKTIDIRLVDLNGNTIDLLNTQYSFVLKVTELIKKVENTEYNTKFGFSFNKPASNYPYFNSKPQFDSNP